MTDVSAFDASEAPRSARPSARDISHWETSISDASREELVVRGHRIESLIGEVSFTEMAFLVLAGRLPSREQRDLLDAVFVSVMDHGVAPSIVVVRMLASFGVPLQAGIAGGSLSFGDWHGGACEQIAKTLAEAVESAQETDEAEADQRLRAHLNRLVEARLLEGRRIEGFGHPLHPSGDARVTRLFDLARQFALFGRHCDALHVLEEEIKGQLGRPIPINIDGAIAATILDLGFSWQAARCFLITPRTIGMTAHFLEELEQGGRWRHAANSTVRYTGPAAASSETPERTDS